MNSHSPVTRYLVAYFQHLMVLFYDHVIFVWMVIFFFFFSFSSSLCDEDVFSSFMPVQYILYYS